MSHPQHLILNVFFMRFGHHPEAWRHHANGGQTGRPDVQFWLDLAKRAEAAKFDTFFVADFIGRSGLELDRQSRHGGSFQFEPFTLLAATAAVTEHIGLVATVNTNYSHPYNVARQFTSLDHISGGRAGWNVVSSFGEHAAKNFGLVPLSHTERYERASEFVELAKAYWDSWSDDAFEHPNQKAGVFFRASDARPVDHAGKYFRSSGLLDFPRPIQGHPVFVQAGNSDVGLDFAARYAEMTYSSAQTLKDATAHYADLKGRLAAYGREPDDLKICPGLSVVVGESDQQAADRFHELQELIDFSSGVVLGGTDLSGYDIDGPLPDLPEQENGKGRFRQLVTLARRENLTIRQLVYRFSTSRGHLQLHGSPKTIVDTLEEWFVGKGADGFNVVPPLPPLDPGGFVGFAEKVVPELQRRGLFRREYQSKTYRENLGLTRPRQNSRRPVQDSAVRTPAEAQVRATQSVGLPGVGPAE